MTNDDLEDIKSDVASFFRDYSQPDDIEFELVEKRYFSEIHEVRCYCGEIVSRYILKISTTDRASSDEYEMYQNRPLMFKV